MALSWKDYLWARTGKVQAGPALDQAHTTILAQEVAEVWLCSFYLVAGLHTTLNRENRSLRVFDTSGLSQ
jgi:cobalamin biosynthesis Co2+ chelatase CbiK